MEMLVIATSVGAAPRAGDDYLGKSQFGDEGGVGGAGGGCVDRDRKSRLEIVTCAALLAR